MSDRYPHRIVCLTEETTETLYLLGQGDRIVGVSGYTVRPPEARQKPKISAFISAKFDAIAALEPDLVLAFSDLQAERLADTLEAGLNEIRAAAAGFPRRVRLFFEEWDEPLISGIRWVEELVEIAGAAPIFPELAGAGLAKDRIVDPAEVVRRDPEIVLASWCGKRMRKQTIVGRPGWSTVSAVRNDQIFEVKSTYILQPGPASLTEGVRQIHAVVARFHARGSGERPGEAC